MSRETRPQTEEPGAIERAGFLPGDDGRVGVYLHLPYCERICPYCDFAVVAARPLTPEAEAAYVEDLLCELAARREAFPERMLASVYFGGGTPSLFTPRSLERLLRGVREAFPSEAAAGGVEVTLELNPSTVERARLPGFREAGVDRLSIGVQSFQDDALRRLGRAHRAEVARATVAAARAAHFETISLDLIFALPSQTCAELDRDLDAFLALRPEHISTYELTFEPETPFGRALASGRMTACAEERAVELMEQIESRLGAGGYARYEISNYALPGRRARHNARYWQRQSVLGLGMGAHSFEARTKALPHGARRANPRSLEAWRVALRADPAHAGRLETLTPATARGESIFLGLRQQEGVSAAAFRREFGRLPREVFGAEIEQAKAHGWVVEDDPEPGDLRLSGTGRLLADTVAALFVEPESD